MVNVITAPSADRLTHWSVLCGKVGENILIRLLIKCLFAATTTEIERFTVKLRFVLRLPCVYGHSANWIYRFLFPLLRCGNVVLLDSLFPAQLDNLGEDAH